MDDGTLSYSFFDKQLIKSTDKRVEFFMRAQTLETMTETNMKYPCIFRNMLFKVVAIQFRLVGLEGAELLKYEDDFALDLIIVDHSILFMALSDMEFVGKRMFERKLLTPIIISSYEDFRVVLHVGDQLIHKLSDSFCLLKGQVSLMGFRRLSI